MGGTDRCVMERAPFRDPVNTTWIVTGARYEFEESMSNSIILIGLKPVTGPVTDYPLARAGGGQLSKLSWAHMAGTRT
jgi:hypothetical protein